MGLMEALGREADRAALLHAEYRKLLGVLAAVAGGKIAPERLTVDLAGESFSVGLDVANRTADISSAINWSFIKHRVGDMHDDAEMTPVAIDLPGGERLYATAMKERDGRHSLVAEACRGDVTQAAPKA